MRVVRVSPSAARQLEALHPWERDDALNLILLLTEYDDLDSLIDDTATRPPLVFHSTFGDAVAATWRRDAEGIVVGSFTVFRPPPMEPAKCPHCGGALPPVTITHSVMIDAREVARVAAAYEERGGPLS